MARSNRSHRHGERGYGGMQEMLINMREELTRFALARQCPPDEVDDLLQDLYVKLTSTNVGPVANPRAYLYQMTNNLIHDRRRGKTRQSQRDDAWARQQFGQELRSAPGASPEKVAIDRDLLSKVDAAIGAMPSRTAEILRMFRVEGLSQKDIASKTGISLSAVEKHLQRAYRQLVDLRTDFERDAMSEDT